MKFHGLFVGIDYYDAEYDRLRYAKRDATALHALFADNLDGKATLLLDSDATKEKFVTEMRSIAEICTDEELVVIAFSGHGIVGGALAMHDTLPDRTAETSLSLDELAELTRGIRARALLLVLDCCFSGHAADKVLRLPYDGYTSRNGSVSAAHGLNQLRRDGHVVLAASGSDQEAFEAQSFRHGLLTHYLIQGLRGALEAIDEGEVYILKLAHYVSKNVSSHRQALSQKPQDPVIGCNLSNFSLPLFTSGPLYLATADAHRPKPATADISSLTEYMIPSPVVEAWRNRFDKLNRLQIDAINEGALLEGMNVLVSAPTSAGKTMVGELAAMRAVAEGRKAVFLLPTRALVNEQYERFKSVYGPLDIRVIRATGELRDQQADLLGGRFELAVLTYEKFIGLVPKRPDLLGAGVLVVDEIQSLMLPERGPLLETLLTWLRVRDRFADTPQIVGLSAVLGKPNELARWLRANLVTTTHRDVPLLEGVVGPNGRCRFRDQEGNESSEQLLEPANATESARDDALVMRLVSKLVAAEQQVIVFRAKRIQARMLARNLARTLGLPSAETTLEALPGGDGGRTTDELRVCLKGGVAFHIADLTSKERRVLELSFRSCESEVRVLVATTTLAQGINLPADTVVVCELEHPTSDNRPYSVSEYKNMAGRAGRSNQVEQGHAIVLARGASDADQKWLRYIEAQPEDVRSALLEPSADVRAVLLAAFAEPTVLGGHRSGADVERFMAATFAAHQSRADGSPDPFPPAEIRRMVSELVVAKFLTGTPNGPGELPSGLALTDLGRLAVRSGLSLDSVAAVTEALEAVPADQINRATLICIAQLSAELDDVRFNRIGRAPRQEHVRLAGRLRELKAAEPVLSRLMGAPSKSGVGMGRARRSLACLMWAEGVKLGEIERAISDQQTLTRRESPGPVQHAAQRAADVLATVFEIVFHVHPTADLDVLADVLPAQLELGIVADLVPLSWHTDVPLLRSVYLGLARAGLTSPADILAADPELLLDCVGGDPEQRHVVREAAVAAQEEADEGALRDRILSSDG
ncbi:DEAD/DEAH box helicase [Streptomyces prunicolor]|uniref:DEAD/DEAH box helicase n=1 Tax=Streptomyces prunicolor TaxID=67348 RepID=UPI00224E887D|nr:DEAD/DEAH box helicase [Streptomyces prunicolor]MCX5233834.1 DEAD/DEAH box helicase [Streptomyces prunicolor]